MKLTRLTNEVTQFRETSIGYLREFAIFSMINTLNFDSYNNEILFFHFQGKINCKLRTQAR